jgi:hypothetical protein
MQGPSPAAKKPWALRDHVGTAKDPVRGPEALVRAQEYVDKGYALATSWREADSVGIKLAG